MRRIPTICTFALVLVYCLSVVAQESSKRRKFQTTYKIDMFAEPGVNARKIGTVPSGAILEALEETARYGGSIKVYPLCRDVQVDSQKTPRRAGSRGKRRDGQRLYL